VLRGVAGFGASSVVHTEKVLRLSLDLPLIIEVVETEEAIQALLPDLDQMIGGGLITLERARVILYRTANARKQSTGAASDRGAGGGVKGWLHPGDSTSGTALSVFTIQLKPVRHDQHRQRCATSLGSARAVPTSSAA